METYKTMSSREKWMCICILILILMSLGLYLGCGVFYGPPGNGTITIAS